ncbi:AraC family transcriptional regulator [Peristeroidobacter soli]|uniref:AraC family transcriptional regulator n=1 Tax=Peristeroidobacter soli TaxID=2497877 RepID=UPI00101D43E9|nr:AraC family transcriptional regulator [Peristeroidobacter soli]
MQSLSPTLSRMSADDYFIAPQAGSPEGKSSRTESIDAQAAVASVSRVFFPHHIRLHHERQLLDFRHSAGRLSQVSFNQITYGGELDVLVNEPRRSHFVLVIPLRGTMQMHSRERSWDLSAGTMMLMSPHVGYRFTHYEKDAHLAVGIPRHRIETSDATCNEKLAQGLDPTSIDESSESLLDYIGFICNEFNRGGTLMSSENVRAGVENTFITMLRTMLFPDKVANLSKSSIVPGFVHRAERFMQQHLTDDIRLDDIVKAAGVPARTLHYGFKRFRSSTPMRWLREKRFEQARQDLLAGAREGVQVIEVAHRYWMHHGGRFAINYQKLFGESPSATLRSALKQR